MLMLLMLLHCLCLWLVVCCCRSATLSEFRQCEPIRIDMCRGIGYNETSMPNLVGHELQSDVEYTLQTFAPLIEYVCSSQLKLFLCAAYVPMCTPKVPIHAIGPCRSLCESVRVRCHPVLQGFGFPWPPALDCDRFPKENNHETMCMEGPGETHSPMQENELYGGAGGQIGVGLGANGGVGGVGVGKTIPNQVLARDCPGLAKANLYMKLQRSGRCASLCDADILFTPKDKYLTEMWLSTWAYAALGVAIVATFCLITSDDTQPNVKWSRILKPLVWCHGMVTIGWTVRFIAGRTATACGFDPQLPNVSLLLVDGLSNAPCAAVFLLRYYFGMAACAWWALLCLRWHRDMRRCSPDAKGHVSLQANYNANNGGIAKKRNLRTMKNESITHNNFVCFVAWGLPAFQTAAVIVARLVDADELIGACFVGNQYDKGLQILVATPIFCYWIFGSMNLVSGYLVQRRNKDIIRTTNSLALQQHLKSENTNTGIGTFLFIYAISCGILLFAIIYEFANIDVWLSAEPSYLVDSVTPLWPFLTRGFMELMLGIICFAWVLGPYISQMYKRHFSSPRPQKQAGAAAAVTTTTTTTTSSSSSSPIATTGGAATAATTSSAAAAAATASTNGFEHLLTGSLRTINPACNSSIVSYKSIRPHGHKHPLPLPLPSMSAAGTISLNQMSNCSIGRSTHGGSAPTTGTASLHLYINNHNKYYSHHHSHSHKHINHHQPQQQQQQQQYNRYSNETLL